MENRNLVIGLILALISATISFITAVFISEFAVNVSTNWMLTIQNLMSLCFTAFLLRKELKVNTLQNINPKLFGLHIIRGMFGLGLYLFYYRSLQLANPTACSLLINTAPLFVVLFSITFLKERARILTIIGVLIGFAGLYLTLMSEIRFTSNYMQIKGAIYAILSGIFFALALITMHKLKKITSATSILLNYSLFSAIVMIVILCINRDQITYCGFLACIFIGVIFCIKQYAITLSLGKISSEVVSMMHYFSIFFLFIYQWGFHNQPINKNLFIGFILILFGVFLTMYRSMKLKHS